MSGFLSSSVYIFKYIYNLMLQAVEAHPNKVYWAVLARNLLLELGFYDFGNNRGWETTMYFSHYLSKGLQIIMSKT